MQEENYTEELAPETGVYNPGMVRRLTKPRPKLGAHLASLRVKAGLSQEELAQRIGVHQQTIAFWEQSEKPPRSEVLLDLAKALGVSVEALLTENLNSTKRKGGPEGKMRKLFQETSSLPRRQQEKIAEFVSAFINQYKQLRAR